jgi:hypothetical protein
MELWRNFVRLSATNVGADRHVRLSKLSAPRMDKLLIIEETLRHGQIHGRTQ